MKSYLQSVSRSIILVLLLIVGSCDSAISPHIEVSGTSEDLSLMESSSHTGTTATEYEIIDLGTLGRNFSQALAINNNGVVVGTAGSQSFSQNAFIWDEMDGIRKIGDLGFSFASGINDNGQVVGNSFSDGLSEVLPFLWDQNSGIRNIGTLGGEGTIPKDINNNGEVVGHSETSSGKSHAFIWSKDYGMRDLGTLGGTQSEARGINENKTIVGFSSLNSANNRRAFIWDEKAGMHNLGTLGGSSSEAWDINNKDQVVGESSDGPNGIFAFIWDEENGMRKLPSEGIELSRATGINDFGQVVGSFQPTDENKLYGFIWDEENGMRKLEPLDGRLSFASAINNDGIITGYSSIAAGLQAVIWRPVQVDTNAPPVANAGPDQTLECTGVATAVNLSGTGSSDSDGDLLRFAWSLNGSEIATGESPQIELSDGIHAITLTVTDPDGASASDEVVITIEDTTPPPIAYTVESQNLWPPNHKMHLALTGISANDVCDSGMDVSVSVTSNEALNGIGDGNTAEDWEIVQAADGSYVVYLRAERSGGGSGRVYMITITAEDASGNVAEELIDVNVAHDRNRSKF